MLQKAALGKANLNERGFDIDLTQNCPETYHLADQSTVAHGESSDSQTLLDSKEQRRCTVACLICESLAGRLATACLLA